MSKDMGLIQGFGEFGGRDIASRIGSAGDASLGKQHDLLLKEIQQLQQKNDSLKDAIGTVQKNINDEISKAELRTNALIRDGLSNAKVVSDAWLALTKQHITLVEECAALRAENARLREVLRKENAAQRPRDRGRG